MSTITELRSVLFDTLQEVKSGKMDIDRAKAISELSQTIINTAKAEIDYIKATGANVCSGFIEHQPAPRQQHRTRRAQPRQPDGSRREEIGMSCGELGKGAKTGEEVKACCGEFETCREMCVVRADRFKWQRDGLLKAAEAAMNCIGDMGPSRPRVEAFVMLQDAIASVKGSAA